MSVETQDIGTLLLSTGSLYNDYYNYKQATNNLEKSLNLHEFEYVETKCELEDKITALEKALGEQMRNNRELVANVRNKDIAIAQLVDRNKNLTVTIGKLQTKINENEIDTAAAIEKKQKEIQNLHSVNSELQKKFEAYKIDAIVAATDAQEALEEKKEEIQKLNSKNRNQQNEINELKENLKKCENELFNTNIYLYWQSHEKSKITEEMQKLNAKIKEQKEDIEHNENIYVKRLNEHQIKYKKELDEAIEMYELAVDQNYAIA